MIRWPELWKDRGTWERDREKIVVYLPDTGRTNSAKIGIDGGNTGSAKRVQSPWDCRWIESLHVLRAFLHGSHKKMFGESPGNISLWNKPG